MKLAPHPRDVRRATDFGEVVQIAYHAPNIEKLATWFAAELGAGPFYLLEHIALKSSLYRGEPMIFDHSSAYGQFGDVMIELIHQHDDQPSAVRDMYDAQTMGLHHLAIFVDDLASSMRDVECAGMITALDARTVDNVHFAMADARGKYGFMLEFYEPSPSLLKFYQFIRRKSENWDGSEVLRKL